jgi:hypothetical protein
MKTVIKLIVAIVLVNAAYRCGIVALHYYQFKDWSQQMVLFSQGQTVEEIDRDILAEAMKRGIPLDPDGVTVRREGARLVADVKYTENVEVFPRYIYPVLFSYSVEAYGFAGASPPPRPTR